MKFDDLNKLKRFFSVMEVDDIDKRVSFAQELNEALLYILLLINTEYKLGREIEASDYYEPLERRIEDTLNNHGLPIEQGYTATISKEIIDTTFRHLDDKYYTSQERALLIAQNEANTAFNHKDYITAKGEGKTSKTWVTYGDEKVRNAHEDVNMIRIPIDELFDVGGDRMRYPHDFTNGSPENLINCRCVCVYE